MLTPSKIVEVFCSIDDFCKDFMPIWESRLLSNKKGNRKSKLSISEVMSIEVLYHLSGYKTFKDFYCRHALVYLRGYFPHLVSYNRMVERIKESFVPLLCYLKGRALGSYTGVSFIDSTPLRVCDKRRINSHKTFDGLAQRGQCSLGWFYGFKLHIVTNDMGEILNLMITPGNVDDRVPLKQKSFIEVLFGKLFGDKGYISKELFANLFEDGIQLITKLKKNMKNKLLTPLHDLYLLRKRAIIESIFDQLKNICSVEHSRHRSPANYFNNIFAGLIAYNFKEKKPSIKTNLDDTQQLLLF